MQISTFLSDPFYHRFPVSTGLMSGLPYSCLLNHRHEVRHIWKISGKRTRIPGGKRNNLQRLAEPGFWKLMKHF